MQHDPQQTPAASAARLGPQDTDSVMIGKPIQGSGAKLDHRLAKCTNPPACQASVQAPELSFLSDDREVPPAS